MDLASAPPSRGSILASGSQSSGVPSRGNPQQSRSDSVLVREQLQSTSQFQGAPPSRGLSQTPNLASFPSRTPAEGFSGQLRASSRQLEGFSRQLEGSSGLLAGAFSSSSSQDPGLVLKKAPGGQQIDIAVHAGRAAPGAASSAGTAHTSAQTRVSQNERSGLPKILQPPADFFGQQVRLLNASRWKVNVHCATLQLTFMVSRLRLTCSEVNMVVSIWCMWL